MRKVIEVPYIDQTQNWPTGCESVSSVMLLQALGFSVTVDEFIRDHLPMMPMGDGTGPDPDSYFAGSPYDPESFGCYPGVIVKALNSYFDQAKSGSPAEAAPAITPRWQALDATGISTQQLLREQIDNGLPVLYWSCIDLKPSYRGPWWTLPDGTRFEWTSNEHCMLLVGYDTDRDTLIFNDPWDGHGVVDYDRDLVEQRHREQKERAVIVIPER